jgi:hypothetical protein
MEWMEWSGGVSVARDTLTVRCSRRTIAGTGQRIAGLVDGPARECQFSGPIGVAVIQSSGVIFIADQVSVRRTVALSARDPDN